MAELKIRPISSWPWPRRGGAKRSPFKASWSRTVHDLELEMWHLGAKWCVMEPDRPTRAVVLSLAALRAVDRYGVTGRGEQYKGFKALPENPSASTNGKMAYDQAAEFVSEHSAISATSIINDPEIARRGYKIAAMKLHPDNKLTGDEHLFKRLQQAKEALGIA